MPKYRYQLDDADGNAVTGELVAAGREEARRMLAEQGFDAERAELTEITEAAIASGSDTPASKARLMMARAMGWDSFFSAAAA